ncbi:NUDIX hydrolase [Candidatus Gottesmanbacteria bacterium]|nr:NUDIX hydrolase [Candidatus Gottesmanbacteria bacterium]
MHKPIYASGFLYHPSTHQILLQQPTVRDNLPSPLDIFSVVSREGEDPKSAFARIILEELHIELKITNIFPVYDYTSSDTHHRDVFVFYAVVKKLVDVFPDHKRTYSWFTFKQISKLSLVDQAKQDIMISERVIHAAERTKASIHVEPAHIHFPKLLRAFSR